MQLRQRSKGKAASRPRIWPEFRDDPNGFFVEVLGCLPWSSQRELNRKVAANDLVACAACNGPGKTWTAARLVLWWLYTREDATCITTANTWTQVKHQLWRELRSAHAESATRLDGEALHTELTLGPKWYALGISSNEPEQVAGFHGRARIDWRKLLEQDNPDDFEVPEAILSRLEETRGEGAPVLVLIDEASLLPEPLYRAFLTLLTNEGSKLVMVGNPSRTAGPFFEAFHPQTATKNWPWVTHRIRATEAPAEIISPEWIERQRLLAGPQPERNPWFQVSVLAEFPSSSDRNLYPMHLLELASEGPSEAAPKGVWMGVDIARHGGDKCVAILLIDGRVRNVATWTIPSHEGQNLILTAKRVLALIEEWKVSPENTNLDVTGGWGWGVHDALHSWGHTVSGVDFGSRPAEDWRWILGVGPPLATRRQELHWILLRCFQERYVSIPRPSDLPRYAPLWSDLTEIQYDFRRKEELWVEPKEEFRSRVGRSPDYSDALLCALSRAGMRRVRLRAA